MRVFAGLPLPAVMAESITPLLVELKRCHPRLNVVKPQDLHVTFFFFGERSEDEVKALGNVMTDQVLSRRRFEAALAGFSQFPERGNPRVIYLSIEKGAEEIRSYYRRFLELISPLGYREEAGKPFTPHITVARNKGERINRVFLGSLEFPREPFFIEECVLFQSILGRGGAEYVALKRVVLKRGEDEGG